MATPLPNRRMHESKLMLMMIFQRSPSKILKLMMQEITPVRYRIVSVSIHNGRCFKLKVTTTRNSHKFEQNVSLDLLLKRNTVLLCFIRYFIAKKIYCESSEVFFTNFLIMFRIFILFSFFISRGLAQGNVHFRLMNLRNLKLIFFQF